MHPKNITIDRDFLLDVAIFQNSRIDNLSELEENKREIRYLLVMKNY